MPAVLLGKELRTEFRSRELLTTTVVFILMVMVLFSFTFDPTTRRIAALWPGTAVAGVSVCGVADAAAVFFARANQRHFQRVAAFGQRSVCDFSGEARRQHSVPADHGTADAAGVRGAVQRSRCSACSAQLLLVFFLGSLGVSVAGTALSAISAQARMRELLLPVLVAAVADAGAGCQHGGRPLELLAASRSCNGRARFSGRVRRHIFDGAMAFRRISPGGISGHDRSRRLLLGCCGGALAWLIAAAYAAFFIAPTESTMGFDAADYFICMFLAPGTGLAAFFVCFVANLALRVQARSRSGTGSACPRRRWALVFTTVVLVTGPIWAKPAWGIWWTWDARLTSTCSAVAAVYCVSHVAHDDGRAGPARAAQRAVRNLCVYLMCRWFLVRFAGGARSIRSR